MAARIKGTFVLQISLEGRKEGRKELLSWEGIKAAEIPGRNVRRYSQGNAECLSGICVAIDIAKVFAG